MAGNMNAIYWEIYRQTMNGGPQPQVTDIADTSLSDKAGETGDDQPVDDMNKTSPNPTLKTELLDAATMEVDEIANCQSSEENINNSPGTTSATNTMNDSNNNIEKDIPESEYNDGDVVMKPNTPTMCALSDKKFNYDISIDNQNNQNLLNENFVNHPHPEQICGEDGMWRPW